MAERTVVFKITPRRLFVPYMDRPRRWGTLVVHRRGGKTVGLLQDLIRRAISFKRPGPPTRYGFVAPTGDQAKAVAWPYLKQFLSSCPGVKWRDSELAVEFPTAHGTMTELRLYSGNNFERIRGLYFDGLVIDEGDDISPNAWNYVFRAALSDYKGWATVSGTPKSKQWLYRRTQEADPEKHFTLVAPASQTRIIDQEELTEIREEIGDAAYEQEYEVSFEAPIPGAIFAKALAKVRGQGRITSLPHAPSGYYTIWDLGSPMNTSVWTFQLVADKVLLHHCDAGMDWTLTDRVVEMTRRGYDYVGHILPHDGDSTLPGGLSYADELRKAGFRNVSVVPRTNDPLARNTTMEKMMDRCWFDKDGCEYGLSALSAYQRRFNDKLKQYEDGPLKNWASHPSDAFCMIAEAAQAGHIKLDTGNAAANLRKARKFTIPDDDDDDTPRRGRVIVPGGIL